MIIWTEAYRPFIMGGDVYAPISTEVDDKRLATARFRKQGVSVCLVPNPAGGIVVAEQTTGAIVGNDFRTVTGDLNEADPEVVAKQLAEAAKRRKKCTALPPNEFWRLYNRSKPDEE